MPPLPSKFESLLFAYEQEDSIDVATLANAMAFFCKTKQPIDDALALLMAAIIKEAGPLVRIEQAQRNNKISNCLDVYELDYGSRSKAHQAVAGTLMLSRERITKIDQGLIASTSLAAFLNGDRDSKATKSAKEAIRRIRCRILANTGKGREARARLRTIGWGALGKGELDTEIHDDVAILIASGIRPGKACRAVAERTGKTQPNVAKIYQRIKTSLQSDIEDAARAAGVRPSRIENAFEKPEILGQNSPQKST